MATANLTATRRDDTGKGVARKLRASGQIPAVIYGHNREPQSLAVPSRELERLLDHISAGSTVIDLDIAGTTARTLIREIQRHPFKRQILHVDFQELVAGETVTVEVPLVIVGTAEGVRVGGGILDLVLREVEVECDPGSIPNHIDVDVTNLTIGHSIHVGDLTLPAGVTMITDAEQTIAVCSAPRVEAEVAAPVEEAAPAEPELIRKPKDEEDEA
ncbi:MAG TPA: 50S ribosomal protein L25/general stress protein Ctc [Gemmatimonadaceae bacterium]